MKIVSRHDAGKCLWEGECDCVREELVAAVKGGANLRGADLRGANLDGANLDGANLDGADLRGAYLDGANLRGANLRGAYLRGAYLDGANLDGANLRGADLRGAYLRGAYLRGANLDGANLEVKIPPMASHAFWSELLLRAAGDDIHRRMVAGLVAVSTDWCWPRMLELMRWELAEDWQQWAGAVFWQWPEECREVGLLEVVPDAPDDGPPGETVMTCSSRDD
jgi:hypothetical protein